MAIAIVCVCVCLWGGVEEMYAKCEGEYNGNDFKSKDKIMKTEVNE